MPSCRARWSLLALLLSGACAAQRSGLYGPGDERRGSLSSAALGLLQFLREGDELLARELRDSTPSDGREYDFVVVGAGSAGATVAARLSETGAATVLLIEAGRRENLLMDVPLLVNYLQFSEINWRYRSEPSDSYCLGMEGRRCNLPRGKVMGGSSVLNYMIATRGHPRDYDAWARAGNAGWSYAELLRYFKRLEDMGVPELRGDARLHHRGGPLHIAHPPFRTPLAEAFLEAGSQMGYPAGLDYNGRRRVGFSYIQASMKNGSRVSSNRAYLHPARARPNLSVSRRSLVGRVLVEPRERRAYGVEFRKAGRTVRVRARREVILCAGAIGSAQILLLSGIGPREHLRRMRVPLVQEAPVGENLMDHIAYGGLVFLVDRPVSIRFADVSDASEPYLGDYLSRRAGPFAVPGGCEALAFLDVDRPGDLRAWPSVELLFTGGSVLTDPSLRRSLGIADRYWDGLFANHTGRHSWSVLPMLMRPNSRGRIRLRGRDPRLHPKIVANYLHDAEDVRVMIAGIRAAIEVSRTEAMRRFGSRLLHLAIPGCEHLERDSDGYWECAIRTFPFTIYHYSGTCKMAPDDDPTGVVNPRLQVKGIAGLRVADASIMPTIITGHPNVPVIMIGEKLADMVKEDWASKLTANRTWNFDETERF